MLGAQEAIILALVLGHVIPLWFICRKAGFSGAWSLLSLLPLIGLLIVLIFLACAEWPARLAASGVPGSPSSEDVSRKIGSDQDQL
jgi:hypothetical protein